MEQWLFISDLHLDPSRPEVSRAFHIFLQEQAGGAGALYILGDLVELWFGDDDDAPAAAELRAMLRATVDAGTPVFLMHGNRDFLIGERFAAEAGVQLLPDPSVIDLFGEPTLLMHGDSLCTDDREYMEFRTWIRDPARIAQFLAMPVEQRRAQIRELREETLARGRGKPAAITDVNQQSVEQAMRAHGVRQLIHGHTHRPASHRFSLDGRSALRVVLGDWYRQGSVLRASREGLQLEALPFPTGAATPA